MEIQKYAPIVLFAYNRLYHTRRTLEALEQNTLASQSELFIYLDGPKDAQSELVCNELKDFLLAYKRKNKIFKHIEIIARDTNLGLAINIPNGITEIVNRYGKIIVIEDDIVTSPYTLQYFNEALEYYEEKKKVYHIAAWNDLADININEDAFLWRSMNCWGWATWADRWKYFSYDAQKLFGNFGKRDKFKFTKNGSDPLQWGLALGELSNPIRTWDIYWAGTVFQQKGLCVNPTESLVRNIGNDISGENCSEQIGLAHQKLSNKSSWKFPSNIKENTRAFRMLLRYHFYEKLYKMKAEDVIHRNEIINKAVLIDSKAKSTIPEANEESSSNLQLGTISLIKKSMKRRAKVILKKLSVLYYLLDLLRTKSIKNEELIEELKKRVDVSELWASASSFKNICKYTNKTPLLYQYNNTSPEMLEKMLAYTTRKKAKHVLEIGAGVSTSLLTASQHQHGGMLVSIEHNKSMRDHIRYLLYLNGFKKNIIFYDTQVLLQDVDVVRENGEEENISCMSYDLRYFSEAVKSIKSFDIIFLAETVDYFQLYSEYAIIPLLEPFISNRTILVINRLSARTQKLIPAWTRYLESHGKKARFENI